MGFQEPAAGITQMRGLFDFDYFYIEDEVLTGHRMIEVEHDDILAHFTYLDRAGIVLRL